MEITIPEIISDNTITYGVGLTIALVGVAVKAVKGLIDFYEDVLIKRYFKRLNSFSEHISTESKMYRYVNLLKENEVFRLVSGIKSSPEKSNALMDIYLLGIASNDELKRVSSYFKPHNMKVSIEVGWIEKLQFTYSLVAAIVLLFFGVLMGYSYFVLATGAEAVAGLIVMTIFMFVAMVVGKDYRTYRILKRVRSRLMELDMVENPEKSISWSFKRR